MRAIGGFPTDSVTEDYLLTLRMKEAGFTTVYLNEPLSLGLAPEGLKEYITQRSRWCLGFMQIVRGRSGPFSRHERACPSSTGCRSIESFLNWAAIFPARLMGLIVPILYFLLDIKSVRANLGDVASYFLPFFIWHTAAMHWMTRGRMIPIMSDVCQLIAAPAIVKAVAVGLLRPQGQKFKVTAKGGDRGRRFVEWPLLRFFGALSDPDDRLDRLRVPHRRSRRQRAVRRARAILELVQFRHSAADLLRLPSSNRDDARRNASKPTNSSG